MALDQSVRQAEKQVDGLVRTFKSNTERIGNVTRLNPRGGVSVGTQSVNYMMNGLVQQFIDGVGSAIQGAVVASMQDILGKAIAAAGDQTAQVLQKLALSSQEAITRKQGLARIHEDVANEAHRLVLGAYDSTVGGNHPSYRAGQGRLVGAMRRALESPEIILAQRDGIIFGNTAILDRTAAHWRRLNFGAGARGAERYPQPAPLILDGQRLGQYLRFDQGGPSPAFSMPRGFWFDGSGNLAKPGSATGQEFFPFGQGLRFANSSKLNAGPKNSRLLSQFISGGAETRGIRGRQFFEPGLFYMAKTLPGLYKKLAESWIQEGIDSASGPIYRAGLI